MSPELREHLKRIAENNARDREWMSGERYSEIESLCNIVISHWVCAGQAAWREDKPLLRLHLDHVREGTKLVLGLFNTLPDDEASNQTGEPATFNHRTPEPPADD